MIVLDQESGWRHYPEWHVGVGDDVYSVRAGDSEAAAFLVADHLGFPSKTEGDWLRMMLFRDKYHATHLQLPDGRNVLAEQPTPR